MTSVDQFSSLYGVLFVRPVISHFQPNRAFNHERNIIAIPPCLSSSALAVPVSHDERLAVREKLRHVGWRPPNHKPNTTKIVA